jgi:hypothetical protein
MGCMEELRQVRENLADSLDAFGTGVQRTRRLL